MATVLDERGWRKRARVARVEDDGSSMAVAVLPEGAKVLDRHSVDPAAEAGALLERLARLRVGEVACSC